MFLAILFILTLMFECIYYIYFINTNKQEKIEYFRDIPSNENPAIVGLMLKGNVGGNDIIATILDLWEKDYIAVEYRTTNGFQQCIIMDSGKDRFLVLKDYENYLLDELFKDKDEVIFEEFVNSLMYEKTFKNMINRRVDIKLTHKVSYKRLMSKINFLANYVVLGFAIFFPFIYLISNNFLLSIIVGYTINFALFIFFKSILIKEEHSIESLLFGLTSIISGVLIIVYLLGKYTYQYNSYFLLGNISVSILLVLCFFIGDYNKKMVTTIIDYIFIYSIISVISVDLIGLYICIIYYTHRLYLKSPKHIYLFNDSEVDKWFALRNSDGS